MALCVAELMPPLRDACGHQQQRPAHTQLPCWQRLCLPLCCLTALPALPNSRQATQLAELSAALSVLQLSQMRPQKAAAAVPVPSAQDSSAGTRESVSKYAKEDLEFCCRHSVSEPSALKANLDRALGLEPVKEFIVQRLRDGAGRHVLKEGKQPRRHVLTSGGFGVGKHVAAELICRLFELLNHQLTASVRVGSRVRLAAWQGSENRGNDKNDKLVAEADLLISIGPLSDLPLRCTSVAGRSCFYMRLTAGLTEADASMLEQVRDIGSVVIMGQPESATCHLQLSAFRRRQTDLLVLLPLSPTDVAMLIAAEVEKRVYEGVGEGDVGTRQLITVLEHIVPL
ncbi:spoVK [Symbiodinium sp. CCMP2456]|nr:spoVK [Symbiodinium sp. CCMP2456]